MLHVLNKTNTIMHDLFLYFKIRICQKKKIKFVYDKDTNYFVFFFFFNFRYTSKEDADQFLI